MFKCVLVERRVVASFRLGPQHFMRPGGVVNITASATCTASIDCQPKDGKCTSCENAIDGNRYSTSWRYVGAAMGVWLQIVFDKTYVVSSLLIAPPYWADERHFKDIKLTFSDGSEQMVTLANKTDGWVVETFAITPPRLISSIKLSVVSAYDVSSKTHALNEVDVYGSIPEETTTSSSQATTISTGVISSTTSTSSPTTSPTTSTPSLTTSTPSPIMSTPSPTTSTPSPTTSTPSPTTSTSFPTTSTATTKPPETAPPATASTSTSTATNSLPSEATTTNNTLETNTHRPDSKNLWKGLYLYILLAAAVAAAMLIFILVIVCSRKKTQTPHDTENGLPPKLDEIPTETESSPQSEAPTEPVASDTEEPTDDESVEIEGKPIEVDQLAAHVAALRNHQDDLDNEFLSLPSPVMKRVIRAIQPEVKHKNRFRDILPYDDTRVPLTPIDIDPMSDYINANYINGYNQPKRFIAAQGPNDFTVNDFWRMVWEQGSTRMLMLANVVESGKKKVAHYWPEDEGDVKRFGDIEVIHIRQESWPDFVIRTFQIKKGDDERMVNHYHFTTWPDRGAPAFASGLINYYFKVESYNADEENPITVHCSAGVGRTGTYIALDWLMRQAAVEGVVDIFKCVATLRTQRMYMEQYEFIHMSLMEALLFGGVTIPCANFKEKFEQLQTPDDNGKSKLDAMYEVLQMFRLTPTEYPVTEATAEGNVPKNRCPNVVAGDVHRPHLNPRPDYDSDYVNAVYVDGHRKQNTFFATQMPLPDTRVDLWRLVEDHECIAIVMLNELQPEDESAPQYWPVNDGSMSLGPFTINNTNLDDDDGIITTDLEVTSDLTKETPLKVKHIRVVDWPNTQALPSNSKTLLRVFQNLMKWRKQNENKPVLVHCWCGEMRCGMFCCLANVWEKINEEQEVDVFNVVRQIRMNRPEFVVDEDQYKFLYQFAQDYIESLDIYANFQ
ncbi:Receptor-type tyrosine-protein phosphatase T [Lamellibrachia satsuma]|nr:Receptor-type tyrosine-protein phosphatase T [Lamellibrachia satsuma]